MKVLKTTLTIAALTMLVAGPALAQTAPPQTPPPQTPPAQPPAANQPATPPQAEPPKPFPEGAKIAYINLQFIVSNSVEGKAASAKIQEFQKKKAAEIQEKQKQAQALQTKLQQGGTVLSDAARSQSEKDLQKLNRDLQIMQEDANEELQELQQQLQLDFQNRLNPVIDEIANEKGLHIVFSAVDAGIIWGYSGVDLSAEVIKRFDAKPPPAKK